MMGTSSKWLAVVAIATSVAAVVGVAGCGGGGGDDDGGDVDASGGVDAATCVRPPRAADGVRRGVISLPYTAGGGQANTYRVFEVDAAGAITFTATTFEMGRSTIGTIAFTPDGELGFVAQSDGSLGVFRLEGATATVLHARFQGSFYAEHVVMRQGGAELLVIDPNTRENGGGVYRVRIGCDDDAIVDEGLWIPARSVGGIAFVNDGLLVAAREAGTTSPVGHDAHLFDVSTTPARVGGADAFGDDTAIVGGVAGNARHVLIGDTDQISGTPNRIAVVDTMGGVVAARQVLTPVEDPLSIVMSPFGDAALVASGFGDALIALEYNAAAAMPFSVRGPLTYMGARPELPGHIVMIEAGALRGLAFVAENLGVRRVRFTAGGVVTDLGKTATGTGTANITGAIGIQP